MIKLWIFILRFSAVSLSAKNLKFKSTRHLGVFRDDEFYFHLHAPPRKFSVEFGGNFWYKNEWAYRALAIFRRKNLFFTLTQRAIPEISSDLNGSSTKRHLSSFYYLFYGTDFFLPFKLKRFTSFEYYVAFVKKKKKKKLL